MKKMFIIGVMLFGATAGTAYAASNAYFAMSSYRPGPNLLVVYKAIDGPKKFTEAGRIKFPSSYSAVHAAKHIISKELTTEEIQSECFGWEGKEQQ